MPPLYLDLQIADNLAPVAASLPSSAQLELWVAAALAGRKDEAELTIRLVDEQEISQLNATYRHKDKATNVLSFPADLPEHIDIPLLGDIIICPAVVAAEAQQQQKTLTAHWAHMVIHGTLHLLGYDHIEEQQAVAMEAIETQLLADLGYPNPYLS
ncbi:rRNA maturation RNase YbeY [Dasania sp. GY-MA-18]|uniref:Endoribonuclease YbeY n=1 Tax=Dasania phycosphaerae TaxID=2950436 RepID=A0A9J6RHB9_9GAMM|nr:MULTISPECIES: rRNA maturation RNase YbeY [Dasania]MCR8921179.1 rRNA maturation RNase YbeY [Dasania sp. GY-MA-18]MCZ0863607.1 rRNA maturation RNase YbeY [Dasania phycosphaerae]MCZ0867335.1 rRNA maturation RNase YbeY [Dasania phycosphaerae]